MVTFTFVMGEDDAFVEFIPKVTMKGAKIFLVEKIIYYNTIQQKG
jgi:hypothetical protein